MNVSEIRQRIFDQMDYNPDLQQYRDSVVRRINDQYERLCDMAHWLFLQKESTIQLRKAITGSSTVSFRVDGSNLRRLVSMQSSSVYSAKTIGAAPSTFSTLTLTAEMEGQTLIDEDSNEYKIIRVRDSNEMFIEPSWQKTAGVDVTNFTIRFDRVALPQDCIEVLGVVDRDDDRGRLPNIDRKRTEIAYLDRDTTGEPLISIDDESFIDQSPINNPIATEGQTAASGNTPLVAGNTYEYMYTIQREGRESPTSKSVQITLSSSGTEVNLSNIDDTRWFAGANFDDSGILKLVYRRDVTNDGRWIMITTLTAGTTTYLDNDLVPTNASASTFEFAQNTAFYYTNQRDIIKYENPGLRQYLRFWYTPEEDRVLHIRYHRRPRPLYSDTDAPEIPRQYHMILVYLTLEDVFLQLQEQNQATIFRMRGDDMIRQLRKRYLSRDDTRKRFSRWDSPARHRIVGDVTGDFLGADYPY
tara:strand:+ start:42 stop:1457 length:1416 start_codon:yes stop_codon:yes gene_type:complete